MKKRKNEDNPIIRKEDLEPFKKSISSSLSKYLTDDYPLWLKKKLEKELVNIVKEEINKKPDWLLKIISETITSEINRNLKVSLHGFDSIDVDLTYKGRTISTAHKYHPRG